MYRPKTHQNLQLLPWKSKQQLFPSFIIRGKIWILFTFANTRSGYAWVQLIHCSSVFTTKQTAAAAARSSPPTPLWGPSIESNSSDSVITTAFAQKKVEREKYLFKKRISFIEKARQTLFQICSLWARTDWQREAGQSYTWLSTASSRQETHRFIWNYKPEFQKAQTTLKPFKLDILYFKQHTMW